MIGLTVVLLIAALVCGDGSASNLTSSGTIDDSSGYWAYNGPFFLATLIGAYTIVGFESAANLAEETAEPTKVVPMAMLRAVVVSVVVGLVFLIALTVAMTDIPGTTASARRSASSWRTSSARTVKDLFLVVVNVGDLRQRADHHDVRLAARVRDVARQALPRPPALRPRHTTAPRPPPGRSA